VVTLVAHLTDLHFGGPAEARARADRVLDHLLALDPAPDLLLVTGDVADHGTDEEYAEARAVLDRWPGPLLVGTGNHDVRDAFARGLLGREADGPLDQVLDLPDARFLMLDSLVTAAPGERVDPGELTDASLAWLDERLSEDGRPAYVCLHHPPVDIGVSLMDPIRLREPERLQAVLEKHPHHAATLVGHAHTQCATTFAGRPLLIGGGVASTVPLDAEPFPRIWEAGPPTIAFHLLHDDGRVVTHWRALPS
jgi:3',5'-cyclic AMP phosphodiesterase CpdA